MIRRFFIVLMVGIVSMPAVRAQVQNFKPVTQENLLNPSPEDWLMFSRTYDAQRFSPLKQINKQNVSKLRLAWTRGMGPGQTETIPMIYRGVMYVVNPGAIVQALDASNGDLLWEYKRKVPPNVASQARTKNLAIYQDIILYTSPEGYVVGLDARTGELRWETKADTGGGTCCRFPVSSRKISSSSARLGRESLVSPAIIPVRS